MGAAKDGFEAMNRTESSNFPPWSSVSSWKPNWKQPKINHARPRLKRLWISYKEITNKRQRVRQKENISIIKATAESQYSVLGEDEVERRNHPRSPDLLLIVNSTIKTLEPEKTDVEKDPRQSKYIESANCKTPASKKRKCLRRALRQSCFALEPTTFQIPLTQDSHKRHLGKLGLYYIRYH